MYHQSGVKMSAANYRAGLLDDKIVTYFQRGAKKGSPNT